MLEPGRSQPPHASEPENASRDAVLSDLNQRLVGVGVDAQPEGVYADDKRADIRVSFEGFNVPVEIKRSCHSDVWTAVREQLIAKYTRDPGAMASESTWCSGSVIRQCADRPSAVIGARRPADEVRQRLEESLPIREKGLISICVVDVSLPPQKRRA